MPGLGASANLRHTGSHTGQILLWVTCNVLKHRLAPKQCKEASNGSITTFPSCRQVGYQHLSSCMGLIRAAHLSTLGSVSTRISLRSRRALSSLLKTKAVSLKTKPASLSVRNQARTEHPSRKDRRDACLGAIVGMSWHSCTVSCASNTIFLGGWSQQTDIG